MNAKEYLGQINTINMRLGSLKQQVQSLWDAATNITPLLSHTPRAPSSDPHRLEKLIVTKVDLEQEVVILSEKLSEIINTINSLPDQLHISILTSRYISRLEWREIACQLHISEGRIFQIHRDALDSLEKSIAGYS